MFGFFKSDRKASDKAGKGSNKEWESKQTKAEGMVSRPEQEREKPGIKENQNSKVKENESLMDLRNFMMYSVNTIMKDKFGVSEWQKPLSIEESQKIVDSYFEMPDEMKRYVDGIIKNASTDAEKVEAIWHAILDEDKLGVVYCDNKSLRPNGHKGAYWVFSEKHVFDEVGERRFAKCLEFSELFVAMARHAGLDSSIYEVQTYGNGIESVDLDDQHAIAGVSINGRVKQIDLTTGSLEYSHKKIIKRTDVESVYISHMNSAFDFGQMGDIKNSMQFFAKAASFITLPSVVISVSYCLVFGYVNEADLIFKEYWKSIPKTPMAFLVYGSLTLKTSPSEASEIFHKLLEIAPSSSRAYDRLAGLAAKRENADEFIEMVKKSLICGYKNLICLLDTASKPTPGRFETLIENILNLESIVKENTGLHIELPVYPLKNDMNSKNPMLVSITNLMNKDIDGLVRVYSQTGREEIAEAIVKRELVRVKKY